MNVTHHPALNTLANDVIFLCTWYDTVYDTVFTRMQIQKSGKRKREHERYTGNGIALPQGRTPNLGHNYTEANVTPLLPRATGAVRLHIYFRFRNNNYLIPEAKPRWNVRPRKKEGRRDRFPFGPSCDSFRESESNKEKKTYAQKWYPFAIFGQPPRSGFARSLSFGRYLNLLHVSDLFGFTIDK